MALRSRHLREQSISRWGCILQLHMAYDGREGGDEGVGRRGGDARTDQRREELDAGWMRGTGDEAGDDTTADETKDQIWLDVGAAEAGSTILFILCRYSCSVLRGGIGQSQKGSKPKTAQSAIFHQKGPQCLDRMHDTPTDSRRRPSAQEEADLAGCSHHRGESDGPETFRCVRRDRPDTCIGWDPWRCGRSQPVTLD